MKILVIGGGAREHALVWKLQQSNRVQQIFCAPGNPGISKLATCLPIDATDFTGLLAFAEREKIDLTVVGPEVPLVAGIVDAFEAQGLAIFGPSKAAAEIEGSKAFAKFLMHKYQIPTANWATFDEYEDAARYVEGTSYPCVIKADGLAAGKGAIIVGNKNEAQTTLQRMMVGGVFADAGKRVVIEEFMRGEEASIFAITDGESFVLLPPAQDHKPIYDGDKGPNTGGMGAYAPAPLIDSELLAQIREQIIAPTIRGMAQEQRPYRGVLYAGLMITDSGPKVVEYNCRFGDPETQVVLPLLASDLADLLLRAATGSLAGHPVELAEQAAVCVVMASSGYPGSYTSGKKILGLQQPLDTNSMIFHAGTVFDDAGNVVTAGGRVLSVTAIRDDLRQAHDEAYRLVGRIVFDGAYYRSDIGAKALRRTRT